MSSVGDYVIAEVDGHVGVDVPVVVLLLVLLMLVSMLR